MNWYVQGLRNYAKFEGRARRKEYWMFVLFNMIFAMVALILDNVLGITIKPLNYGPIYMIYALATFLPGLGLAIRRLHDVGKSGWFFLIALIPCVGSIWLLVLLATDSQPGENQYGANPKEAEITM